MKYFGIPLIVTASIALAIAAPEVKKLNSITAAPITTDAPKKTRELLRQRRCYSSQFECANGQCINQNLLCNGRQDCRDGTDEAFSICFTPGGRTTSTSPPSFGNIDDELGDRAEFSCEDDEFLCTSGECIRQDYICDGRKHCSDGSDELATICPGSNNSNGKRQCLASEFRCRNGECVFAGFRCDGIAHCADSSDEDSSICQTVAEQRPVTTQRPQRPNTGSNNNANIGNKNNGNTDNNNKNGNTDINNKNSWGSRLTPCNVPPQPTNGRWRLHRSLCDSNVECNAPLNVRSMDPGSYLVYSCDRGFVLNGTSDVLCGPGGQWIHTPKCDQIKCFDLSSSTTEAHCMWNNVIVSCEIPAPIGTIGELKCRKGFVQEVMYEQTYKKVKCQPDGKWSPKPITCVKKPKKVKLVLEGDMIIEE